MAADFFGVVPGGAKAGVKSLGLRILKTERLEK